MNEQNREPDTTPQLANEHGSDQWRFVYPNIADFNFNYYKLLKDTEQSAIAENTRKDMKIAIIGAGIAGMVAAHELFRCGYTNIDIYEASDRIGGRTWSQPVERHHTTYECARSQGSNPWQTQVMALGVSRSTSIFLWTWSPISAI